MKTFDSWDNELYHHGIPGMKWGVRRFQNADGSLTSSGQKRYGNEPDVGSNKRVKNVDKRRKILKVAAGVGITAAVAYIASKGIKNKAKELVDQNTNKRLSELLSTYNKGTKNITDNLDLNTRRMDYNIRAASILGKALHQKAALNKSAWKSLKYAYGK